LLLSLDTVFPTMRPEAAELRIGLKTGQQIIRHRRDRVIATEALIEGLCFVAHDVLLELKDAGPEYRIREPRLLG
jgi:hypothetical protein